MSKLEVMLETLIGVGDFNGIVDAKQWLILWCNDRLLSALLWRRVAGGRPPAGGTYILWLMDVLAGVDVRR